MNILNTIKKLFWVSRPISWPNTSYPFAVGFLIASSITGDGFNLALLIIGTLYFIGPYNLLMYGINDVFDYESDIKNPRKGGVEGMRESRELHPEILKAVTWTNIPFLIVLLILSPWIAKIVLVLVVFSAIAYSLKGLRFKEIPLLDSITSSCHFVGPLLFALALTGFPEQAWPWVAAFFLWGMASHAYGAVQDIIPDRKGGIHSIATAIGALNTMRFTFILYALAAAIVFSQGLSYVAVGIAGLAYLANTVPYLHVTDKTSAQTNRGWRRFLWLNYASGAVITFVIILQFTSL